MSLFTAVEMAPRDPILGLNEQFNADVNPNKVNLGVGVYYDDNGKLPLLECVQQAEKQMMEAPKRPRLPADRRHRRLRRAVKNLVFGADSEPVTGGRVATIQALGGTGGLKVGADFLKRLNPGAKVLISDPSWENHRALFTNAGFTVETYPYYDAANARHRLRGHAGRAQGRPGRHDRRAARLLPQPHRLRHHARAVGPGDRSGEGSQARAFPRHGLPGLRLRHRRKTARWSASSSPPARTSSSSTSFSKSFSLYGERVGALSVLCKDKEEAGRVLSQLKIVIRTNYSNPPIHGGTVVADGAEHADAARPVGEGTG